MYYDSRVISIGELRSGHPAAPEYLVDIFIIQRDYGYANNARLASWLHLSRSAVSQGVTRLKNLSLVEQDEYGGIRLSPEGRPIAVSILTRHYLIEHLLVRILDYPWDKADEEASRIQETISDDFTDYLFEYLGKPQTCPHGNPFPDSPVEKELVEARKLSEFDPGSTLKVVRITEEGENVPGMLTACYHHDISPGKEIELVSTDEDGVELRNGDRGESFRLPNRFTRHIRVLPVSS